MNFNLLNDFLNNIFFLILFHTLLSDYQRKRTDKLNFIEVLDQCSHSVERFDGDDENLACKNFDMDHKGWRSVNEYDERFYICHMDSRS